MKVLLIDDEILNIKSLQIDLERYCPDVHIAGTADNVRDAIAAISIHQPDIIFSDIQIHDSTFFDIWDAMPNHKLKVILFTAFDQYAINAIKHGVVDYLLKPVQIPDLLAAVQKARDLLSEANSKKQSVHSTKDKIKYISIHHKDQVELIKTSEILYLESCGSYTSIVDEKNKKRIASKPLKDFENLLPSEKFMRVHNSYVINIDYVASYIKTRNGTLVMKNAEQIPVSALRKKAVQQLLGF